MKSEYNTFISIIGEYTKGLRPVYNKIRNDLVINKEKLNARRKTIRRIN